MNNSDTSQNHGAVLFHDSSYLAHVGWLESQRIGLPVDRSCAPIPGLTYPALAFLENRGVTGLNVFEVTENLSPIWWSARAGLLISAVCGEDVFRYVADMLGNMPVAQLIQVSGSGDLPGIVAAFPGLFDLAVLDLMALDGQSLPAFMECLSPRGVVVLNHADFPGGSGLARQLLKTMRRIDFEGLRPCSHATGCTSIFYREGNCLGL